MTTIPYIQITDTSEAIKTTSLSEEHVTAFTHRLYDNRQTKTKTPSDLTVEIQALDHERASISKRTLMYMNFHTKAPAYRLFSRTERTQKHTEFFASAKRYFESLIESNRESVTSERHVRTKRPTFYTCSLRYAKVRKNAEQAVGLLIMKDDKPYLYAVCIGEIQYSFYADEAQEIDGNAFGQITVEDYDFEASYYKEQEMLDEIEECDAELVSELVQPVRIAVESSCELLYDVELKNTHESSDDDLESVLASLDEEFELMLQDEDAKQQRFTTNRMNYAGTMYEN
ncbi:TPA: hypothetical protein ACVU4T_000782 [Vibrio parahaemolyticus]|nr:hypothetical protein [Vibrio parahaemolyticus]